MWNSILIGIISIVTSITGSLHLDLSRKDIGGTFKFPGVIEAKTISDFSMEEIETNFKSVNVSELNAYVDLYNSLPTKSAFTGSVDFTKPKGLIKVDTKSIGLYKEVLNLKKDKEKTASDSSGF